jgi:membrane protein involved in colicin uptake
MSEENLTATETEASQTVEQQEQQEDSKRYSQDEVANLMKALKSEREARKTYERQIREKEQQLEKFAEINPSEYQKLQADAARAAEIESRYGESIRAIEEKYGRQAAEAEARAKDAELRIQDYRKRYALEKVFNSAGGRMDAADGVSFFDMFAEQLSGRFRQETDGSLTVVDSQGDPILDNDTGKRISPEDYITSFKVHPVYGTFFKGVKGSGAGLNYAGTDSNGMPVEDLSGLSRDELFLRAFG